MSLFNTTVDLQPAFNGLITFMGTLLLAVLTAVGMAIRLYVVKKLAIKDTELVDQINAQYDLALKKGIAYAESTLGTAAKNLPAKVDVHNAFVKQATDYVLANWQTLLAKAGIDPKSVADHIIRALPSPTSKEVDALTMASVGGAPGTQGGAVADSNVTVNTGAKPAKVSRTGK